MPRRGRWTMRRRMWAAARRRGAIAIRNAIGWIARLTAWSMDDKRMTKNPRLPDRCTDYGTEYGGWAD
eukprot:6640728-Prymnesium_polylepis.1